MTRTRLFALSMVVWIVVFGAALLTGWSRQSFILLGLTLCILLFLGVLHRPTRWVAAVLTLLAAGLTSAALRPVCQPLTPEQVASIQNIEARTADGFTRQPDGSWAACKTAISRWFFM